MRVNVVRCCREDDHDTESRYVDQDQGSNLASRHWSLGSLSHQRNLGLENRAPCALLSRRQCRRRRRRSGHVRRQRCVRCADRRRVGVVAAVVAVGGAATAALGSLLILLRLELLVDFQQNLQDFTWVRGFHLKVAVQLPKCWIGQKLANSRPLGNHSRIGL